MKPDFSGYATKANIRCSDGRTINKNAFVKNDGEKVPLVWQHGHASPENVLGHALLENREDGVYAFGYFNKSEKAQSARESVRHGDITKMSIYANRLVERDHVVHSGQIREVSLVLAGANPGAIIENVNIKHADGYVSTMDDEAIIQADTFLQHSDDTSNPSDTDSGSDDDDEETVEDIINTLNDKQKEAVLLLLEAAEDQGSENSALAQSDIDTIINAHKEELTHMTRNIFEQYGPNGGANSEGPTLSHDDMQDIFKSAQRNGSLQHAIQDYALEHSISNVEMLFPEFKTMDGIQKYDRNVEWVEKVIGGVRKVPVARVRTMVADLTPEEARAKGYVKGNLKKEQIISLLKRTTEPTTIYKKQGIDRDDLIDITDFDVVGFYWAELRGKLKELLAECILFGDGRSIGDEDHVPQDKMRPIATDDDFYATKVHLPSNISASDAIDQIIRARAEYRGSGNPTLFTSVGFMTDMLLLKDKNGRRIYSTNAELASALRVSEIVEVEHLQQHPSIVGIIVNLKDYTLGTDKGGEATTFEDFDIDYNKHKYLIETRNSGALNRPKAAIVLMREEGEAVIPQSPSFNSETNTIMIPTKTGVEYSIEGETVTGSVEILSDTQVDASAKEGYYIPSNTNTSWTFVPTPED